MKRWHQEYPKILNRWRKHRKAHVKENIAASHEKIGCDPYVVDCVCDEQVGRFRKSHSFASGKDEEFGKFNHVYIRRANITWKEYQQEVA
jgi:hypothetical protein